MAGNAGTPSTHYIFCDAHLVQNCQLCDPDVPGIAELSARLSESLRNYRRVEREQQRANESAAEPTVGSALVSGPVAVIDSRMGASHRVSMPSQNASISG